MDLSSMLNDSPTARTKEIKMNKGKQHTNNNNYNTQSSTYIPYMQRDKEQKSQLELQRDKREQVTKDKTVQYQLSTSLQYIITKDIPTKQPLNNLMASPFRSANDTSPSLNIPMGFDLSKCLRLDTSIRSEPTQWKPKLSLDLVMKDQPLILKPAKRSKLDDDNLHIQLTTHEVIIRGDEPKLLLEDSYEIQGAYPRGFFVMMAKRSIQHNFVFTYPDHPWFEDLYGLRKSAYIGMRTEDGELWELHLKPSRDKLYLFGYLIKHVDMIRIVKESMNELIFQRKLPLVLDLDDTLVRLVGEGNDRYVPEADIPKCGNRIAVLKDGRRVVLTERVHEFLEWAQNLYDISVCSLGDQNYVENVVNVLDPQRTRIRGILYSARSEHDYIKRSPDPGRPPKDLLALYSFCALKDKSIGSAFSLPIILDDETRMWPSDQHDNIIEVKNQMKSVVWTVSLFPVVQDTLAFVHSEFFRQFDIWYTKQQEAEQFGTVCTRQPPSAISIYKTYLRHILRDMISKG